MALSSASLPGPDIMAKSGGARTTRWAAQFTRGGMIAAVGAGAVLVAIPLTIAAAGNSQPNPGLSRIDPIQAARYTGRVHLAKGSSGVIPLGEGRHRLISSMLDTHGSMTYGQYRWDERGVPAGPVWVRVDTGAQTLSVFRGSDEIGTSIVLYGANSAPTPVGHFRVLERIADHHSRTYDAAMPYTLRLTDDGVAIHGSEVMRGAATHGCIGVPVEFARRLFSVVRRGDEVYVVSGLDSKKPRAASPTEA